ncbi:MAG: DEAD/DEAH box helicase [Bacteroidota bacterium]|nr:DEAD/DEAH box helicase [Bacteroidota bacterium]
MENLQFHQLSLSDDLLKAIDEMGYVEASPIQSQAIPYLLEGRDVIGQAQTGTGKTAAFSIPLLEKIDPSIRAPQGLVLCPTRELALQVTGEIKKLGKHKRGINSLAIYGGDPIDRQISALKRGVHIIVGTPGRVIDHLKRKTLDFSQVNTIVLDEADEMLDMGFREDIEIILENMPEERQTVLFSATMAKPILALTKKYQKNPMIVKVVKNELTVSSTDQYYFEVKSNLKSIVMTRIIDQYNLQLMLVFCNTKRKVDEVVEELQSQGYHAEGLHGDMNQSQRNRVMGKFRSGLVNILVATDVAARGIDVNDVDAVFNFDLPLDPEYYVHRIGRTGRAGKSGKSFTFISSRERSKLKDVERFTKVNIIRREVPSADELIAIKRDKFTEKIKETILGGELDSYDELIENLTSLGFSKKEMISALVKIHLGEEEKAHQNIDFSDSRESRGDRYERSDRGDRGERSDRGDRDRGSRGGDRDRDRERGRPSGVDRGKMARLFINLGKKSKISPGDIVGAIAGETGISGDLIGSIEIYDKFSFVEVPKKDAEKVIDVMNRSQIKGKPVNIEVAKAKQY